MVKSRNGIPLIEIEEILPILNKIAIFGGLSDKQLYTIFRLLEKIHYKKGERIFEKGDSPDYIYIVLKGSVELFLDVSGNCLAENVFTVGDCFGETSVIGIIPHTANTIAKEETDLILFSREDLFTLWDNDKELFGMVTLNIAREACRRLNKADQTLLYYFANKD